MSSSSSRSSPMNRCAAANAAARVGMHASVQQGRSLFGRESHDILELEFLVDLLVRLEEKVVELREDLGMTSVIRRHLQLRITQKREEVEQISRLVRERERERAEREVYDDNEDDL